MEDIKGKVVEAEIIIGEDSPNITDDTKNKYEGWDEFLEAVEEGKEVVSEPSKKEIELIRKDHSFDVDKALDTIDLTFPGYTPSEQAFEFFNIIRLVLGTEPEVENSIMHYFLIDLVFGNVTEEMFPFPKEVTKDIRINPKKIAIIASRRSAKSTILTAFLPIYVAITGKIPNFGKVMFWVSFGDAQHAGAKVQANTIRDICIDSTFCKGYFEKMRFTDEECEFLRKGSGSEASRSFMFKVKGASGSSVRGIRYRAKRIDCHAKGTMVHTDEGWHKVEDYSICHGVYKEDGVEVKVKGLPFTEKVSLDHKYWVKRCINKNMVDKEVGKRAKAFIEYAAKWKEANSLDSRDWIGTPIDTEVCSVQPIQHSVRKIGVGVGVSWTTTMKVHEWMNTDEFWWLYGLFLGNGNVHISTRKGKCSRPTGVAIIVGDSRPEILCKLIGFLSKHNKKYSVSKVPGCSRVIFSDTALANWLKAQYVPGKWANKIIPEWVLKLELSKQKQLLRGYIDSDGYIDNRSHLVRISSVCKDLLVKMQIIGYRLGLPSVIRNTKKAGTQTFFNGVTSNIQQQWDLAFRENVPTVLGIDIKQTYKVKFKQVHISDGMLWRQVDSVTDCGEIEVVPITVKDKPKGIYNIFKKSSYLTLIGMSKNCLSFDDIIKSEADARSPVIMQKLNSMIYSDAESAMNRNGKLIIINTPFTKKDPVYSALENGVWTPMCVPMCEKIYEGMPREEFVGSWPQMNDYEWAMERYLDAKHGGTLREFNQELMLRIASEEDKLIKKDQIQWYSKNSILRHVSGYKVFATTDYTASNSKKGDFSGTALWAMNSVGDVFLLELSLRKDGIEEQFEHIFRYVQIYTIKYGVPFIEVGVEINGQQQLNIASLRKQMQDRNVYFTFARQLGKPYGSEGISRGGGTKHDHFMRVHPLFQGKHIYFPEELKDTPDMKELLEELNGITYTGITSKCFSADTNIATPTGYKKIHSLQCNDIVYSFDGIMSIPVTIKNIINNGTKLTYEICTEDTTLYLTSDHKVLTTKGYKQVSELLPGSKIIKDTEWQLSNATELHGEIAEEGTTNLHAALMEKGSGYIDMYMSKKEVQYLKECMYTTKTITKLTTRLIIWKYLLILNIKKYILTIKNITCTKHQLALIIQRCRDWLNSLRKVSTLESENVDSSKKVKKKGYVLSVIQSLYSKIQIKMVPSTAQAYVTHVVERIQAKITSLKGSHGYVSTVRQGLHLNQLIISFVPNTVSTLIEQWRQKLESVNSVKRSSALVGLEIQNSAQQSVLQKTGQQDTLILVKSAILYLRHLDKRIAVTATVDTSTVNKISPRYEEAVYDITVSANSCFIVDNGLIIHNCDDGIDLISMVGLMDLQKPAADDVLSGNESVIDVGHGNEWIYPEDDDEFNSSNGSTIF